MSGFTVGVAVLGGLVLGSLVAYNAWVSRRNSPRQPDAPIAAKQPIEPTMAREPVFDDTEPSLPPVERKPPLDALIDAIARSPSMRLCRARRRSRRCRPRAAPAASRSRSKA